MARGFAEFGEVADGFEVYEELRETPVASARDCCDSPRVWRLAWVIAPRAAGVSMRVSRFMTSSLTAFHEVTER